MKIVVTIIIHACILWCVSPCFAKSQPSTALLEWQHSGTYFTYQQHQLFYRDTKNPGKETIVMLHGFPTSSWDWHYLWDALRNDYRLIAVDFIGFGFSDKPKDIDYTIAEQSNMLIALLKNLGVTNAHLLVHDYGTFVAQELIAKSQSKENLSVTFEVNSLTMLNGPTTPEDLQLRLIQKALNSPIGWMVSRFANAYIFKMSFSPIFGDDTKPSKQQLNDFWYVIRQRNGQTLSHKLMHYYRESFQYHSRWLTALQTSEIPILLISGLADPVAGKSMVSKYKQVMPDRPAIALPDIGHYPHVEAPDHVLRHYKTFLLDNRN